MAIIPNPLNLVVRQAKRILFPQGFPEIGPSAILRKMLPSLKSFAPSGAVLLRSLWEEGFRGSESTFYDVYAETPTTYHPDPDKPTFDRGGRDAYRYEYHVAFEDAEGNRSTRFFSSWSSRPVDAITVSESAADQWTRYRSQYEEAIVAELGEPVEIVPHRAYIYPGWLGEEEEE
jgi:hypothetical protein